MINNLRKYMFTILIISIFILIVSYNANAENGPNRTTTSANGEETDWIAIAAIATILGVFANFIIALTAYGQMRASQLQANTSRLQGKIDRHCEQLRELFRKWKENLYKSPKTGFEVYNCPSTMERSSIFSIENDPLYSDIENHLPPKFVGHIQMWEKYKSLLKKYSQKQNDIIEKIKAIIYDKQRDGAVPSFISESIYLKAVDLLINKSYYGYENKLIETKKCVLVYSRSDGQNFSLSESLTVDEIAKIQDQHKIISNDVKNKYEKELSEIVDIEKEIQKNYNELNNNLGKLIRYPEYEHMDCEYIYPR